MTLIRALTRIRVYAFAKIVSFSFYFQPTNALLRNVFFNHG